MATPTGIALAAARQAASGYALRALPRRKTYTTSWDINVLAGSVRQVEQRLRVSIRLVDARSGYQTWSTHLEQGREKLFLLQDQLLRAVIEQMAFRQVPALPEPDAVGRSRSVEAHEAFLLGRDLLNRRPPRWRERALEAFDKALAFDDGFARAHAGRAMALSAGGAMAADPSTRLGLAAAAASRALELDDRLGMSHAAQGLVLLAQGRRSEAEGPLRRALALDPLFSPAYNWLGVALQEMGREHEALQVLQSGLKVDPLNPVLIENLGARQAVAGRHDDARRTWERGLALPVRPMGVILALRGQALEQGRLLDALRLSHLIEVEGASQWGPLSAVSSAVVLVRMGLDEEAAKRLTPVLQRTDALPAGTLQDLEDALHRLGRLAELPALLERVAPVDRAPPWLREQKVRTLVLAGRPKAALATPLPDEPRSTGWGGGPQALEAVLLRAWALQLAGSNDEAHRILAGLALGFERGQFGSGARQAMTLATFRLQSGERERALAELERALAAGWTDHRGLSSDPRWQPLLGEPRVQTVLAEAIRRVDAERQALQVALAAGRGGDFPRLDLPLRR